MCRGPGWAAGGQGLPVAGLQGEQAHGWVGDQAGDGAVLPGADQDVVDHGPLEGALGVCVVWVKQGHMHLNVIQFNFISVALSPSYSLKGLATFVAIYL